MKGQKITALLVLIAMLFQCTVPVFAETVPEYPSGTSTAEHTDAGQPLPEETQAPEQTDPEEIFTMEISEEATALYADPSGITWTYTLNKTDEATLTGFDVIPEGVLELPEEVDGYPVIGLKANLFQNNTHITGVVIPVTVTSIGNSAFRG